MAITSYYFFSFLLSSIIIYYLIPSKVKWMWLLLISATFFVLSSGWEMIPYLVYGIIVTYIGARIIEKCKTEKTQKIAFAITIFLTLSELCVLKYLNFFIISTNLFSKLFSIDLGVATISLAAPIGISYYTLSILGYVIDVYRKVSTPQKNIFKHALFVCYFPQMIAGPVTRYNDMEPQLFAKNRFNYINVKFGLERVLWGLFKKLVIADRLAPVVDLIFNNYTTYSGMYIFVGVLCYAFQLYADFSGCLDIVIGASQAFGIKLPENFNVPFSSESLSEFWRRWHITLGIWFKDYLLYPILKTNFIQDIGVKCKKKFGKKAGKKIPTFIGLFIIWFAIGIWHGGTVKFMMASGMIPCFYLIFSEVCQPFFEKIIKVLNINVETYSYKLFKRIRTLLLMCVCFGLSRANSFMDGLRMAKSLVKRFNPTIIFDSSLNAIGLDVYELLLLFTCLIIIIVVDGLHERGFHLREQLEKQNIIFQWIIELTAIFAIIIFGIYGPGYNPVEFIYGGF